MKKCVIYARTNRFEDDINIQIDKCKEFIASKNYKLVSIYSDEAGGSDCEIKSRYSFSKMITDSKCHNFDCVVVSSMNRFPRITTESLDSINKLKSNYVEVVSIIEHENSVDDTLRQTVLVVVADYYKRQHSMKVKAGIVKAMQRKLEANQ